VRNLSTRGSSSGWPAPALVRSSARTRPASRLSSLVQSPSGARPAIGIQGGMPQERTTTHLAPAWERMRRHHADSRSWIGKHGHLVSVQTWCQTQPHREDRRLTAGPPGDTCRIQLNSIMLMTIAQGGARRRESRRPRHAALVSGDSLREHFTPSAPGFFPSKPPYLAREVRP
jgi:hypothetical protein